MATIEAVKKQSDAPFVLKWALATCLGGTVSWVLSFASVLLWGVSEFGSLEEARRVMSAGLNSLAIVLFVGVCLFLSWGLLIALAQALVMHCNLEWWTPNLGVEWVLTSWVGWALGFLSTPVFLSPCWFFAPIIMGIVLALAQWLTLRGPFHKDPAIRAVWTMGTAIGITLGAGTIAIVSTLFNTIGLVSHFFYSWDYALASTVAVAFGLLVYGLVTGFTLANMERHNTIKVQEPELTSEPQ